ncbi:MAG: macro domain-containing protein [Anaerolineaceae bacterium]|nr:macro domain-containing protein [Anaerolineaceae bacterium]
MAKLVHIPPDQFFTLRSGDNLFASRMQTLAIPVNTHGVMGKGLAKETRLRFPEIFRRYSELCENGELLIGKPRLVKKPNSPIARQRSNLQLFPTMVPGHSHSQKYFLLFPTKGHWREKSKPDYLETGLKHVKRYYKTVSWKLESLALPALGCGLGGLPWRLAGPLMCSILAQLEIPVELYLPREKPVIPPEQLTTEFLLGEN